MNDECYNAHHSTNFYLEYSPQSHMRIIFLGDSLTQGTLGVNYVEKVAAAFPQHQFRSAGVNGDTSLNLYRRAQRDVIDLRPDGVFIMIGINDAVSSVEEGSRHYYRWVKGIAGGRVTPIAFRENLRAVLSKLNYAEIKSWVALPPVESRPEVVNALREMNTMAIEVCTELGVPVLDVMREMTPAVVRQRPPVRLTDYGRNLLLMMRGKAVYEQMSKEGGYTYSFDGVHLTADGAQRLANLIIPFLKANGVA